MTDRDRPIARIISVPVPVRGPRMLPPGPDVHRAPPGGAGRGSRAYLDSSVILRVVLGEPDPVPIWRELTEPLASQVVRCECLRAIGRARIRLGLDDAVVAGYRADVLEVIDATLIEVDRHVLDRASEPFPTLLGSLGAIHSATALVARESLGSLAFATHDRALAIAAVAAGSASMGRRRQVEGSRAQARASRDPRQDPERRPTGAGHLTAGPKPGCVGA